MTFEESDVEKLSKIYPDLAERWKKLAVDMHEATGRKIKIVQGYRSFGEQLEYYKHGRVFQNGQWKVIDPNLVITNAEPGSSLHNYGLAIDSAFTGGDPYLKRTEKLESQLLWNEFGKYVEAHGMIWGGRWDKGLVDSTHCEIKYGMNLVDIRYLFQDNGLNAVWKACTNYLNKLRVR